MIKGFREFIMRGNVIDLAVAVVIGAAFTAIVNAIVQGLINPLISAVFNAKSLDKAFVIAIPTVSGGTSDLLLGSIIGSVIQFLAVAVVVYFAFVYPMNHFRERAAARAAEGLPDEPEPLTDNELLAEIRDLLKAQSETAGATTGPASNATPSTDAAAPPSDSTGDGSAGPSGRHAG
jgi:large conductance mechanosensitive channel